MSLPDLYAKEPSINIRMLNFEPLPGRTLMFDVDSQIGDEQLSATKEALSRLSTARDWVKYAQVAAYAQLLAPKYREQFEFKDELCEEMVKQLTSLKDTGKTKGVSSIGMFLKNVFPQKLAETDIEKTVWESLKRAYDGAVAGTDYTKAVDVAGMVRMILPDRFHELNLENTVTPETYCHNVLMPNRGNWYQFLPNAMSFRCAYPSEYHPLMRMDGEMWQHAHRFLDTFGKPDQIDQFLWYVLCMKCIDAEEIFSTDSGISVIMPPKPSKKEVPPLPQDLRFQRVVKSL